jgi:hypothetical protein
VISTPTLPDRPRLVITPAQASEWAIRAYQLRRAHVRHTQLGPVTELRCSCGDLITDQPGGDDAFDAFCCHGLAAVEAFVAQLVPADWLDQLIGDHLDGLNRQLADQAALGTVTPPAVDGSTVAWLNRHHPLDLPVGDDEPQHLCGCLIVVADVYGHRLGCAVTR